MRTWILNDAANYSNLILDPDLDSYWLMDAFVAKLPAIADDLATMSVSGCRRTLDQAERRRRNPRRGVWGELVGDGKPDG